MSEIRVTNIIGETGVDAVNFTKGINVSSGIITATSFSGSGANLTGVDSGLASVQVFTSNGTWNRPSGITKVKVIVTGGGGGGGGGGATWNHGAGGDAGGTAIEFIDVSSTASVTVTVGNAGPGANWNPDATNGGTSSFGSFCSATGGRGGKQAATSPYTSHNTGVGSGGDINLTGQSGDGGHDGGTGTHSSGGTGGSSFWGGGGCGLANSNNPSGAKEDGKHGGGGGGTANTHTSGDGGAGIVVVEEYK